MMGTRIFGLGAFVSSAWLVAAPAMPGACGGAGGAGGSGGSSEPVCGNGVRESAELCDGTSFVHSGCSEVGSNEYASGGRLNCNSECLYDLSECRRIVCGDGRLDGYEECDGTIFTQGYNRDCTTLSDEYRSGRVSCNEICQRDTSTCVAKTCGNGRLDALESCEGNAFAHGDNRCESWGGTYKGGTLGCTADCGVDTSACERIVCGNGIVEPGEDCDGANLGNGTSCETIDQGYIRGVLRCGVDCRYDVSSCVRPTCGDGIIEGHEICDGTNLGSAAGKDCSQFIYATSVFGVPTPFAPGPVKCGHYCDVDLNLCQPQPGCYIEYPGGLPTTPTLPWRMWCVP
jgi:hypothetical protein